jgi:ubiquinone/menaquinone biosynthesis C-methylase UbiE
MNIINYFSGDEDKRARFIFNLIAPVYGLIDRVVSENYRDIVEELNRQFPLAGRSVLDVGTGTGGWIAALARFPLSEAAGVDFSEKMIRQARKKHPEISFEVVDGKALSPFSDNSFDIVTCSFVMHGMKRPLRQAVLREMFRVARRAVVIHDFYGEIPWSTRLLEKLEKSDYKNFLKTFTGEMKEHTPNLQIITVNKGNGLYIGRSKSQKV